MTTLPSYTPTKLIQEVAGPRVPVILKRCNSQATVIPGGCTQMITHNQKVHKTPPSECRNRNQTNCWSMAAVPTDSANRSSTRTRGRASNILKAMAAASLCFCRLLKGFNLGVLESVSLEPKVDLSPLDTTWEEGTLGLVKDACAEVGGGVCVWRTNLNRTHLFLVQPTQRNLPGVYFLQRTSHFRQYCIWLSVSGAGCVTLGKLLWVSALHPSSIKR